MKTIFQLVLIASCLFLFCRPAIAQTPDLGTFLERPLPAHPRLFFKDAEKEALTAKIEAEPLLKNVYQFLLENAAALKTLEPEKRVKVGKRLLGVSRAVLQRVSYLAFAYRMTGDEEALRRAEQEMLAVAAFEDWNPSHFLDVAEMTAALGIGYDWLYAGLSPESRAIIRTAIVEKGLRTSMKGGGWTKSVNNWNQVCHGGLVVGALAVQEDEPALAKDIIERALANVPRAMAEYEPDGVYPEGPSYWGYGTTYNVVMIAALESALGTDFGLGAKSGFLKSAQFYLQATSPAGLYFNYSDCGERGDASAAMQWFAGRLHDPALLWNQRKPLEAYGEAVSERKGSADRMLPLLLVWGQRMPEFTPPQALSWKGDGRTPVAILRTGWNENDAYLAIKGGSPGTNHAHMDAGSFVLEMSGVRWAIDLGSQGYESLESKGVDLWNKSQQSQRWSVFRLNNRSHNTLVVNDALQAVDGNAPIQSFSADKEAPKAVVDLSPVYQGQLESSRRGARLTSNTALIQDEVKPLDGPVSVRWGLLTHAAVEISPQEPALALLRLNNKTLMLRVLSPRNAALILVDTENPPQSYDAKNPDTRMICFETNLNTSEPQTLAVFLSVEGAPGTIPDLAPLDEW